RAAQAAVTPTTLPGALEARRANVNTQYFLAELYRAVGYLDEALNMVDQALKTGLGLETEYRDAPAQQLKGELLEARGELQDASTSLYEAGRRFLWRNDYEPAATILRHAIELNPKRPAAYWYFSDALRMLSFQPSLVPEQRKKAIEESVTAWDQSVKF